MRTLITFLFLFSSFWSISQDKWDFENSVWHYNYRGLGPIVVYAIMEYSGTSRVGPDSTEVSHLDLVVHYANNNTSLLRTVYVYADEDRVYQWLDGEFHVLYDFTVSVGDTMYVYGSNGYDNGYVTTVVDTVSQVIFNADTLRAYHLKLESHSPITAYAFGGWVIEKMGNLGSFVPESELDCDGGCPNWLRCFKNSAIDYQVEVCDTIKDLRVSTIDIDEELMTVEPRLYPNPLSRHEALHIEYSDISSLSVSVFDMEGRVMLSEQAVSDGSLSLPSDMSAGVYMVHVVDRDSRQSYYDKLVVY